jgi:hypothetical protein
MPERGLLGAIQSLVAGLRALILGPGASPEEKRRLTRVRCDLPVYCEDGPRRFSASVVDLGQRGLRLRLPAPVAPGTVLAIYYAGSEARLALDRVVAEVRWCRRPPGSDRVLAGLEWAQPESRLERSWARILLHEMGYESASIFERRRWLRADSSLPAVLRLAGGGKAEGRVANLGLGGALVETEETLPRRAPLEIELGPTWQLPALRLPGVVLHSRPLRRGAAWLHGVQFSQLTPGTTRLLGRYLFRLLAEAAEVQKVDG